MKHNILSLSRIKEFLKYLLKENWLLEFCECSRKKERKNNVFLCPVCDIPKQIIKEDKILWERDSKDNDLEPNLDTAFLLDKDQFYLKKEVWQKLNLSNQGGIRFNKNENFLVIFMDAPELYRKPSQGSNIYHDTFDNETGLYRYTGAGQTGPQTLDRENGWLVNAEQNYTQIHFFRQFHIDQKHQYIGQVQVEKIISSEQPDSTGVRRSVFIFYLRPITK